MDETHSLLLNEDAFQACSEPKKAVFIFEWLRYLDRILPITQRADLKLIQPQLVQQLEARLHSNLGPPTRLLLARCISRVFVHGDNYAMYGTINTCNDILKAKDDSPSQLPVKLTALTCLAALYENLGRMVGRTYEDTFAAVSKWMKSAESQGRAEILITLTALLKGLGSAAGTIHKDMYKMVRSNGTDRALPVRIAAIQCLTALVPVYTPLFTTELESVYSFCVRALDGASYETRMAVAQLLAKLFMTALAPPQGATMGGKGAAAVAVRPLSLGECLSHLSVAFLKGGVGGYLRTSTGATAGGQREVRVGIIMGYVEFIREVGAATLERQLAVLVKHVVDVAAKCGELACTSVAAQIQEAVMMRRCLSYLLRATIGSILSEQAQRTACKMLGALLTESVNSFDYNFEPGREVPLDSDAYANGCVAVICLLEISALVRQIGTAVTDLFVEANGIMEPIFTSLMHPVPMVRVATAWCLRCVTLAVPRQLTPLIDRCINRLEHMRMCADAISGYSIALASLLAASVDCKLGIPHGKPKQVLQYGYDLLKTSSQQSRLAQAKITAGWMLAQSLTVLGTSVATEHMPRLMTMWKVAFPRSVKEAEEEKGRGDAFSWQCQLESRAGALAVMCSVAQSRELLTDDVIKSMLLPLECSLVTMNQVGTLIRSYGSKLRHLMCVVRQRVYTLLLLLPTRSYENMYHSLLRELVADIVLSDNPQSTQMTSLGTQMCAGAEQTLLNAYLAQTDQAMVENQLQSTTGAYSGCLENDLTHLITGSAKDINDTWPEPELAQAVCLDQAILAYSKIFGLIASKHRVQVTEHFTEVISKCKQPARQQAMQLNVLCALTGAFRSLAEQRHSRLDSEVLRNNSFTLLSLGLASPIPQIRAVAAEGIGRLAQAVNDPAYVASIAQTCFNQLNRLTQRDAASRCGYALTLGCLHRHVGSLGSGQHLNTGVSIVLALSQDASAPVVQAWSLVSLGLIAETGGGMFRGYVEAVLSGCLKLLLSTQRSNVDVIQSIGKLLSALMTCVGPELSVPGPIESVRQSFLVACAIQLSHTDPLVASEALAGLQQMHLYAPRYVNINHLVQDIAYMLASSHLCLRKAAVCCLRQLVQREAREVREHAQSLVPQGVVDNGKKLPLPETGLEGALFGMLDVETDPTLRAHIQETVISLVQGTCGELLNGWLSLCKDILGSSNSDGTRTALVIDDTGADDEDNEQGADDTSLHARAAPADKVKLQPRWPTRVFAIQIVGKVMSDCDSERAHFDLALAKELQSTSGGRSDYLVLHLVDLVRMPFMAATSVITELRLAGLESLQDVITRFSSVADPDFPGHVILEQSQAQVGAALRPAFTDDTPSHVTAAACQVCSTWIGSGVARNLSDLRRVHQLLVSSLSKLQDGGLNTQLYSESAATLEKLAILKAWAEVYVTAVEQERERERRLHENSLNSDCDELSSSDSLLSLVQPELTSLVDYWLAALHDAAALSLSSKFACQLSQEGGAFYKTAFADVCREYYRTSWPPILLGCAIWLKENNFKLPTSKKAPSTWATDDPRSRFHVMLGLAVEILCNKTTCVDDVTTRMVVRAVSALLSCEWCQLELMTDIQMSIELCNVLHRLILTRDNVGTQQLCVECAECVLDAALCAIRVSSSVDVENGNVEETSLEKRENLFRGQEGGEQATFAQGGTLSFALMELALCVLVRQIPQLNAGAMRAHSTPLHMRRIGRLSPEAAHLVRSATQLVVQVPILCSPEGKVVLLPIILYLVVGVLRESARVDESAPVPVVPPGHLTVGATTALQGLRTLVSNPPTDHTLPQWMHLMRSALHTILLIAEGGGMDRCVVMLSAVVLVAAGPRGVVLGHKESFHRLVGLVRSQLRSENTQVVCKTLQSLCTLFSRGAIAAAFVKQLGRDVWSVVSNSLLGDDYAQRVRELSDDGLTVLQEAVKVLEVVATTADAKRKLSLVNLLTQALVRLLGATSADEWRQMSATERRAQEFALSRVEAVARVMSVEFKKVVEAHPHAKRKLEAAVQLRQTVANVSRVVETHRAPVVSAAPTIRLTMDFNALGKAAS